MWFASKSSFSGTTIVEIAANLGTILFNDGHVALLNILELSGIKIGETVYDYCHKIDEERVSKAERQAQLNTREGRLHAREDYGDSADEIMDNEELLYGLGIDSGEINFLF